MYWFKLPLLTELAKNGDSVCQYYLGCKYLAGTDVPKDYDESLKWFRLSADQGHAEAKEKIGTFYWIGISVEQDLIEASKWFRIAAEQGASNAQYLLGVIYLRGLGNTCINFVQAHAWLSLADAGGEMSAQSLLSECEDHMTSEQMVEARILAQHLDLRIEGTLLNDLLRLRKQERDLMRAERKYLRHVQSNRGPETHELMPMEKTS